MTEVATTLEPQQEAAPADSHGHDPFLAHHFGSARQQFDAGKFGMWLFLVTEVLFFSGLFCAYAVYRRLHPEAFANADQYLDVWLGATNTAVLIFSSLTMAWAVRASQLGQQRLLVRLLAVTLACASIFLGVKAVEYSHKWDTGILWASRFAPAGHAEHSNALLVLSVPAVLALAITLGGWLIARAKRRTATATLFACLAIASATFFLGVGIGKGLPLLQQAVGGRQLHAAEHVEPGEAAEQVAHGEAEGHHAAAHDEPTAEHAEPEAEAHAAATAGAEAAGVDPVYTGIFFSIYYVMTGLHAVHILAGMGAIVWILRRSLLGHFGPGYFGPVDYVGLYWHLVDLIWIYLFPLLYLIG